MNINKLKQDPFYMALWTTDELQVRIDDGFDINEKHNEMPLICFALQFGNTEIVKFLLEKGVDVNTSFNNVSFITMALQFGNMQVVEILLDKGVDVNSRVNNTPLVAFAFLMNGIESVKLLVSYGAKIEFEDFEYKTLLDMSLLFCDIGMIDFCLEQGLKINDGFLLESLEYTRKDRYIFPREEIISSFKEKKTIQNEFDEITKNINNIEKLSNDTIGYGEDIIVSIKRPKIFFEVQKSLIEGDDSKVSKLRQELDAMPNVKDNIFSETWEEFDEMFKKSNEINPCSKAEYEELKNRNFTIDNNGIDILIASLNTKLQNDSIEEKKKLLEDANKEIEERKSKLIDKLENLNKTHKHFNQIRVQFQELKNKMNLVLFRLNTLQDRMTELKIIDLIKLFIQYGGDINYQNDSGKTVLMFLSEDGYADCIELLIHNGVDVTHNIESVSALSFAYKNSHHEIVRYLIENGANVNCKTHNSHSLYHNAVHNKDRKLIDLIKKSSTYINHNPDVLVKLLQNFTIDKPIKYSTHNEFKQFYPLMKKEYGGFDGYMDAVKKQFESIESELEELSPNLYEKIYTFLLETNPDEKYSWCSKTHINIGWSSLEGLREWCDEGNNPFDFVLKKPITYEVDFETITIKTFEGVINLFKQEIEVRDNFKNLENLFANQVDNLGESFHLDLSTAKLGRQFYTDTQKFSNVLDKIFADMSTRTINPDIEVSTTELDDRSIEIKITQVDSFGGKNAQAMYEEINDGDFADIKESLTNLCDWSIESSFEDEHFRVNYLHSNNVKDIEILESKIKGFTHILRFYK